ncbi:hypothetical protein V1460_35985 [Streptomyces sp. SCSIO 30461]
MKLTLRRTGAQAAPAGEIPLGLAGVTRVRVPHAVTCPASSTDRHL